MNPLQVLLIEDNLADAELLSVWLDEANAPVLVDHVVMFADACERWLVGRYDALVLDLDIPDGFGLELLHKALGLAGSAPVVVLTGNVDAAVSAVALRSGAAAYVLKGREHLSDLLAALRGLRGMPAESG